MKKIIILILVLLTGCATTKKMFSPFASTFRPINVELGMSKEEVSKEFGYAPEKIVYDYKTEVWIYRFGQGTILPNDKLEKRMGSYEWFFYFEDDFLVKEKRYNF